MQAVKENKKSILGEESCVWIQCQQDFIEASANLFIFIFIYTMFIEGSCYEPGVTRKN